MGSKTRLSSYCTKRGNNGVNLVTSRNINTRLARPIPLSRLTTDCRDGHVCLSHGRSWVRAPEGTNCPLRNGEKLILSHDRTDRKGPNSNQMTRSIATSFHIATDVMDLKLTIV